MPYRQQQFENGEIYHVVLRGLDNNLIFKDMNDYYRGVFSIYEFNAVQPITIQKKRKARARIKKLSRGPTSDTRDKMVDVLAFCLMPNHLHLLLKQIKEEGISKFMQKIGTGYAGYFNRKHHRRGHLFQQSFGAIHIKNENQLRTVFVYIHTNPVALVEANWKEKGIKNPEGVIEVVENYKWSSYPDYVGQKNFPSVTEREFLMEVMGGIEGIKGVVEGWIKYKGEIKKELFLE